MPNNEHLKGEHGDKYRAIKEIMLRHVPTTICFEYTDSKGQVTRREAEPYKLELNRLWAWCLERDALRQFSLDGIKDPYAGKTFVPSRRDGQGNLISITIPGD